MCTELASLAVVFMNEDPLPPTLQSLAKTANKLK